MFAKVSPDDSPFLIASLAAVLLDLHDLLSLDFPVPRDEKLQLPQVALQQEASSSAPISL